MATKSSIEWTEMTWNPVTGCKKISPGCKHCYAEILSRRLKAMGAERYRNGFSVAMHEDLVELPMKWKRPRTVFVNSMSDLFQEQVPVTFIRRVFETMAQCPQHQFQVLTKRAERLSELTEELPWSRNVWMGVSIETQEYAYRARLLRTVPAAVRFLSVEPLLGRIDRLPLKGIHWVIVGGESGPGARPMKQRWVENIFRQCRNKDVPFFFKQWGWCSEAPHGPRTLRTDI
jgi:protein gp37